MLLEFAMGSMEAGRLGQMRLRLDRGGPVVNFAVSIRFGIGARWFCFRQDGEDFVEEVADVVAVFGGDGDDVADAEPAEIFGGRFHAFCIDFVDGEEERFAGTLEETGEVEVGGRELGAAVDDHDDGVGFVESEAGLAEDFGGDESLVVGDDAAGVDQAGLVGLPVDEAVDAVAGDAGLVADDGAAGAGEAVEEGGFADVGAADYCDNWPLRRTRD